MSPSWFASTNNFVDTQFTIGTGFYLGLLQWRPNKNPLSKNPGNGSHLWQEAPGQNSIPPLGATSGTQICKAHAQVSQFLAWQGNLTATTYPKGCQHVQSTLPNKAGR